MKGKVTELEVIRIYENEKLIADVIKVKVDLKKEERKRGFRLLEKITQPHILRGLFLSGLILNLIKAITEL